MSEKSFLKFFILFFFLCCISWQCESIVHSDKNHPAPVKVSDIVSSAKQKKIPVTSPYDFMIPSLKKPHDERKLKHIFKMSKVLERIKEPPVPLLSDILSGAHTFPYKKEGFSLNKMSVSYRCFHFKSRKFTLFYEFYENYFEKPNDLNLCKILMRKGTQNEQKELASSQKTKNYCRTELSRIISHNEKNNEHKCRVTSIDFGFEKNKGSDKNHLAPVSGIMPSANKNGKASFKPFYYKKMSDFKVSDMYELMKRDSPLPGLSDAFKFWLTDEGDDGIYFDSIEIKYICKDSKSDTNVDLAYTLSDHTSYRSRFGDDGIIVCFLEKRENEASTDRNHCRTELGKIILQNQRMGYKCWTTNFEIGFDRSIVP